MINSIEKSDIMEYDIEISLNESLTDAANRYYKEAKKFKKKIEGVKKAIEITRQKLKKAEKKKIEIKEVKAKREKEWFEKYRFSFTRKGKLILAGRDATSNEIIVKRYMEKNDLHFHTNINGSAHVILKKGQEAEKDELEDAAKIAAIYSKAWNAGLGSIDVYFVKPEQVTKTAQSGEFLKTGAFVIRGERNWFKKVPLELTIGIYNYNNKRLLTVGNKEVFEHSIYKKTLIPGNKSKNEVAKTIINELKKKNIDEFTVDDVLHILPAGKYEFKN